MMVAAAAAAAAAARPAAPIFRGGLGRLLLLLLLVLNCWSEGAAAGRVHTVHVRAATSDVWLGDDDSPHLVESFLFPREGGSPGLDGGVAVDWGAQLLVPARDQQVSGRLVRLDGLCETEHDAHDNLGAVQEELSDRMNGEPLVLATQYGRSCSAELLARFNPVAVIITSSDPSAPPLPMSQGGAWQGSPVFSVPVVAMARSESARFEAVLSAGIAAPASIDAAISPYTIGISSYSPQADGAPNYEHQEHDSPDSRTVFMVMMVFVTIFFLSVYMRARIAHSLVEEDRMYRQRLFFAFLQAHLEELSTANEARVVISELPSRTVMQGDEPENCSVCLDAFRPDDKLRILPCLHEGEEQGEPTELH